MYAHVWGPCAFFFWDRSAAQIMYPVMQCTDIFFLQVLLYANRPCLVWFSC
jgi:hypothetical protein